METIAILIFSYSIFIFFSILAQSADPICQPAMCDGLVGPLVRFPFRLKNLQPPRCGYPGFDLYCNNKNQTILKLLRSGEFKVDFIDYNSQALYIDDPNSCLPNRILNFSLSDSSFSGVFVRSFTFLNCSSDWMNYSSSYRFVPLSCLSGRNYTVLAANSQLSAAQVPSSCQRIANVSVPQRWSASPFYWSMDLTESLELVWSEPACWKCENEDGGICGFKGDSGLEIGCSTTGSSKSGLSRGAKYGLIIGVGIPGLMCIIGLACYTIGMIKAFTIQRRRQNSDLPTNTISEPQLVIRAVGGLDMPTIASYPKTVLGDSGRLHEPIDGTCPICLCEYQPKETLRSIPACNHYFHADCIDEWLKLNATCPLCRNSPESSMATPCSSMSLSSSSQSTSDHS